MKLVLCFSVVCQLMTILRNYEITYNGQGRLVAKYISCLDENNCILKRNADSGIVEITCNTSKLSNIMKGKNRFILFDKSLLNNELAISKAIDSFKKNVTHCFFNDTIPLLILSLKDIIENDEHINGIGHDIFEKYLGSIGDKIEFPDFMIRILLYVAANDTNQEYESDLSFEIFNSLKDKQTGRNNFKLDNINILTEYIRSVEKRYSGAYTWDRHSQILTIDRSKIVGESLDNSEKVNGEVAPYQNINSSEDNCNENSIATEEILAGQMTEKTNESLPFPTENVECVDKVIFTDYNKSQTYSQEKNETVKHSDEISEEYRKCGFCTEYIPFDILDMGRCLVKRKIRKEYQHSCKHFNADNDSIDEYENNN